MKILVAVDSFKGSMASQEAADSLERGFKMIDENVQVLKIPVSDGGEGMVDAFIANGRGRKMFLQVNGPLEDKVEGFIGISEDGDTAYVEVAAAIGLYLIPRWMRDPLKTSTLGVGELILRAAESGVKRIIVGLGGSSTNDGGMGMAIALGIKFFDKNKEELQGRGEELSKVHSIDVTGLNPLMRDIEVVVACDVDNPLTGNKGATYTFAPQKGASPEDLELLEMGMKNYRDVIQRTFGIDVDEIPGAGAAGGLGAAMVAYLHGNMKSGTELLMEHWNIKDIIGEFHIAITGEGKFDHQTLHGKVPAGIIGAAKEAGVPVIVVCGINEMDEKNLAGLGVQKVVSINPEGESLEESMRKAKENAVRTGAWILKEIKEYRNS